MSEDKKKWLGLGKDSDCRCLEFYTDLTQLCEGCPLKTLIPEGIQFQIVAEAEDNRELMPPNQFRQWIEGQISAATAVMQQMRIDAMHPAKHYPNVLTEHFIWNKERAKALRRFVDRKEDKPRKAEPERLPEFAELFFNEGNAAKVRGLMPPNLRYYQAVCFAMATALKEKQYCRPKYSKEVIARVLAAEFYGGTYPEDFRASKYTKADRFTDHRMEFYGQL